MSCLAHARRDSARRSCARKLQEHSDISTALKQLCDTNVQLRLEQDNLTRTTTTLDRQNVVLRHYIYQLHQAQAKPPAELAAAAAAAGKDLLPVIPRAPTPLLPPYAYSTFPAPSPSPTTTAAGPRQAPGCRLPVTAANLSAFARVPPRGPRPWPFQAMSSADCSGQMTNGLPQSMSMMMDQHTQDGAVSPDHHQQNRPLRHSHAMDGDLNAVAHQGLHAAANGSILQQPQAQHHGQQQPQQPASDLNRSSYGSSATYE